MLPQIKFSSRFPIPILKVTLSLLIKARALILAFFCINIFSYSLLSKEVLAVQITNQSLAALREQIRPWANKYRCEGITPTKTPAQCNSPSTGSGDADSILFSGILYYSGEKWAGQNIENSKDGEGGMWRSPQRLRARVGEWGINRFSQDQMLGVLLYLVAQKKYGNPNKAREFADHWSSWMENHLSQSRFALCPWDLTSLVSLDACTLDDISVDEFGAPFKIPLAIKGRGAMVRRVFDYVDAHSPVRRSGFRRIRLGDGKDVSDYIEYLNLLCKYSSTGGKYNCHFAQVASLILQEMGDDRRIKVDPEFLQNPFALWVNNGRKQTGQIRELVYNRCSAAHQTHAANPNRRHDQWTWERSDKDKDSPVWEKSFGWDCIAMINLLVK
ncbi:hypothetical protein GKIL_1706 [Gloeobacter kilaueensis JS1]|uniref:Uncharacterized protein n=2 Tax=Gloeobacter TaxID=33071 RepID=U5QG63_GLOK1|nr:hypothetical protein GKIL_1706 [Gloeobacter kilaueensis JS1]